MARLIQPPPFVILPRFPPVGIQSAGRGAYRVRSRWQPQLAGKFVEVFPVKMTDKSYLAKAEEVNPDWFVVDADGEIVGRLAVRIATVLMGKHKPSYTPHVDTGDFVVVLNCEKIRFSGKAMANETSANFTKKMAAKEYDYYTGYPAGRKVDTAADLLKTNPEKIITEAVRRMLPKNKLARKMLSKLKVYKGSAHPHQAQLPQDFPAYV